MITTLTGSNSFGLHAALRQHVDSFLSEYSDMGLERLDGEESSYDRMRESLESLPFLAPKKLVVLQNPSANKEFAEKASELLDNVPDSTDVIIVEPKLDKRLSYYKYLKKSTDYQEFAELDDRGLSSWLITEVKNQGGTLSSADARYLVDRVGVNQQLLSGELAKLLSYNPQITRQTIDLLTDLAPQSTIFELLDAALSGQTKQALQLYSEQRAMKVDPQQIIALLGWQLHVLAVVKTAGDRDPGMVAKAAKLNPYVVRKSQGIVRRLSVTDLRGLIRRTLDLDIRLKSQPIDADEALIQLIMTI